MNSEEIKENEVVKNVANTSENGDKKSFKREKNRFEFALFANDSLICKRNFPINGYVDKALQSLEFKDELDRMIEIIKADLNSKARIYTWYHIPEFKYAHGTELYPEWEPEVMTEPLAEEWSTTFKFVILDNDKEVVSRIWDGRYLPLYVRKNVDLTNRQVKITKGEQTYIYDKERFFSGNNAVSGELYVLKHMISDKADLIPMIQKMIYEVCSSFDGYFEKKSDYNFVETYNNRDIQRDENGKGMYTQSMVSDEAGNNVPLYDAFGNPWMVPLLETETTKGKKYSYNIDGYNKKIESQWGAAVAEKTKKYFAEQYPI